MAPCQNHPPKGRIRGVPWGDVPWAEDRRAISPWPIFCIDFDVPWVCPGVCPGRDSSITSVCSNIKFQRCALGCALHIYIYIYILEATVGAEAPIFALHSDT